MNENEYYHYKIIEILTAFVRDRRNNSKYIVNQLFTDTTKSFNTFRMDDCKSANSSFIKLIPVEEDIQAIITVIGRRNTFYDDKDINRFKIIDLSNTNLYKIDLSVSDLTNGNYKKISFRNAILIESENSCTYFDSSDFSNAHLEKSHCFNARFINARLFCVNFENADCSYADFTNSYCTSTYFRDVDLSYADFKGVATLYRYQFSAAKTLFEIKHLPKEIESILKLVKPELFNDPDNDKNNIND